MGQTRKCLIKGTKPGKVAKTRRSKALRMSQDIRKLAQDFLPQIAKYHEEAKKGMKDMPKDMRKLTNAALQMSDPKNLLVWISSAIHMNEQYANMPPLPPKMEAHLLEGLETANTMLKENLEKMPKTPIGKNTSQTVLSISSTKMPDLFSISSGCAWEESADPRVQKAYKQRMTLLHTIRSFYEKAIKDFINMMENKNTGKLGDLELQMKKAFDILDLWDSVPAGPTLEAEQERIVYFTHTHKNAKIMIDMAKQAILMLKKLMAKMKKGFQKV
jgi:hypothetical protein